jgi:hypothetical protein
MKLIATMLALLLSTAASAQVTIWGIDKGAASHASIIKGVCLHTTASNGASLHTTLSSEESGLEIRLRDSDGNVLTYDATGEIEALAALDTWVAPSANNIRILVQTDGCYQLAPAAATFDDGDYVFLTIRDTSTPAFGDYQAFIPFIATPADMATAGVAACTTFGCATEGNVNANETKIDSLSAAVRIVSGTATGGSTTTAQDTVNLTQAANDWFNNRSMIVFTSGNVAGHVACIRDFVASTDTVTFQPAAPNAIVAQQFVIIAAPQCATNF